MSLYEQLTGPVRRLHHVKRYSSMPVLHPENVAEHQWQVAFICQVIYWDQKVLFERSESSAEVEELGLVYSQLDPAVFLPRAICHDISESMSGDIIRSFKYSTKAVAEAMKDADDKNTWRLSQQFGKAGELLYAAWREAKTMHNDRNCELVAFADVVAVVTYCAEEWHLGNRHMDAICKRAYEEHLLTLAGDHMWLWRYVGELFPDGQHTDIYRTTPLISDGDFKEEAQR